MALLNCTDVQLATKLEQFLGPVLKRDALRVSGLERKSTGMSRENWTFVVEDKNSEGLHLPLILRRDPVGGMLDTDRQTEYEVLVGLRKAGLPIPAVIGADMTGAHFGRPSLVMEIAPGKCEYFVLNGDRALETRLRLAGDFLNLMIDMQSVDWRAAGLGNTFSDPGHTPALRELDNWSRELKRVALESLPEMELIRCWLAQNAISSRRIVIVHGDFKPGNALIKGDKISAILDWETAHLGDPLEDLGWITNPARASEHQIVGYWERGEIIEAFRARSGYDFDESEVHWWNVFSCWKLAIIVLTGLRSTVDGKFDRIHHNPTWLYRRMLKMVEV